jgi:hypothetical protein
VLGMDPKFVPTNMSRMKDDATWMPRLSTSFSHLHTYIYELLVSESTINSLMCT